MHCFIFKYMNFIIKTLVVSSRTYKVRNEETWKLQGEKKKKNNTQQDGEHGKGQGKPETIYTQRIRREKKR